jgi:hypothetical protein
MRLKMKDLAIVAGSALAANAITEMAVLKPTPDSRGLVMMAPGFGADDLARAGVFAGVTYLGFKFFGGSK